MVYEVNRSDSAELDLDGILHYITYTLANPKAAGDLLKLYEEKLKNLRENPRIYPLSRIQRLARMGYRRFVFGNYVAFFKIDDEGHRVNIVRIFYQRQDYAEIL